jgi:CheY-like chemotaxis protein
VLCARQAADYIENARLYVKLREADRRKDEFLAVLAHELRNPLAPITNALHLMRLSGEMSPANERMHGIIERQVGHLVRLVDDLLEASRITRGKIDLRKEQVDLAAVVRTALETSRPTIEAAAHQLAVSFAHDTMLVDADPVRLAQVISNLLNNAAKFTPAGGQIWISARAQDGHTIVSVRDSGVGIAEEMLPRVFEMFAQGDQTRVAGGLGIGLALAQSLVRMQGGEISAHSEGLGKGSEFVIRLPLVAADARRRLAAPLSTSTALTLPRRRILVVDDARAAVFTLARLLEVIGQQVFTAHDAATALEIARNQHPEVVISDIGMPGMSGYELAHRLRTDAGMGQAVLVALTGYGQDSDRRRAIEAGFDLHLVKPVSLDVLRELLASLPAKPRSPQVT